MPSARAARRAASLFSAFAWLLLTLAGFPASAATSATTPEMLGARLYREGLAVDGTALTARVQGDVPLPARAVACMQCHRRSGLGVVEGGQRSAPIDAAHLFQPATGSAARPAYDTASLLAAVNGGIAAGGRPLSALMPRYHLSGADVAALERYLRSLGSVASTGVTEDEITIASIISDQAPAAERDATRRVLARYVAMHNADTRHEALRRARARRHPAADPAEKYWRRWRLQWWELHGDPATWERQLADYQSRDPAFAVVGGTAGRDWPVVHRYCESAQLPCLLPLTSSLPTQRNGWYSLYFNAGVALEARITALAIGSSAEAGTATRVLVVHDDSETGSNAWRSLLDAWPRDGRPRPSERVISSDRQQGAAEWHQLLATERPDMLVAWVDAPHLAGLLAASVKPFLPARIYTAETFTDLDSLPVAADFRNRTRHVYPWRLPQAARAAFPREQAWLRTQELGNLDPRVAGRVLFAAHVFGEALGNLHGNFTRDYLMEGLEHMLDGSDMTTLLPRTSLGPGQRVLSRGAYVLAFGPVGSPPSPPRWLE